MNEYRINHLSRTIGSIFIVAGIMAAQTPVTYDPYVNYKELKEKVGASWYRSLSNTPTNDAHKYLFTYSHYSENTIFEEKISEFYHNLLSNQEPLGRKFEKVLYENIGKLYVN